MTGNRERVLSDQVQRINDTTSGEFVDVIVQMESDRRMPRNFGKAAGTALARRRMSLTPRDILPGDYDKSLSRKAQGATASTRSNSSS